MIYSFDAGFLFKLTPPAAVLLGDANSEWEHSAFVSFHAVSLQLFN